jgi:hypothetical protein
LRVKPACCIADGQNLFRTLVFTYTEARGE